MNATQLVSGKHPTRLVNSISTRLSIPERSMIAPVQKNSKAPLHHLCLPMADSARGNPQSKHEPSGAHRNINQFHLGYIAAPKLSAPVKFSLQWNCRVSQLLVLRRPEGRHRGRSEDAAPAGRSQINRLGHFHDSRSIYRPIWRTQRHLSVPPNTWCSFSVRWAG